MTAEIEALVEIGARISGIEEAAIVARTQKRHITFVRYCIWAVMRYDWGWYCGDIGRAWGYDHTTVMYGSRVWFAKDAETKKMVDAIRGRETHKKESHKKEAEELANEPMPELTKEILKDLSVPTPIEVDKAVKEVKAPVETDTAKGRPPSCKPHPYEIPGYEKGTPENLKVSAFGHPQREQLATAVDLTGNRSGRKFV